jgi:hypothetical protein
MSTTEEERSMATTTKAPAPKTGAESSTELLQHALRDIDQARTNAQGELRTQLDDAYERIRGAMGDLRDRASDEVREMEDALDRASETLRIELGLRAVRAQRSTEALTKMSSEIRKRKAELTKA